MTLEEKRRYCKKIASFINKLKNRFYFPGPRLIIIEQWILARNRTGRESLAGSSLKDEERSTLSSNEDRGKDSEQTDNQI